MPRKKTHASAPPAGLRLPILLALSLALAPTPAAVIAAEATTAANQVAVPIPAGWQAAGEVLRLPPDRLWEYINGADALFLDYGCQELAVADIARGERAITLSLYDHGTPLNAFGIFQRERGAGGEPPGGLDAPAVLQPPLRALLAKDRFYVKLEVVAGDLDAAELGAVLRDVAGRLPGRDAPPAELSLLPAAHQVPGSVGFARRDFLGLAELRNCLHATYRQPDGPAEYQVFLLWPDERFFAGLGPRWQVEQAAAGRLLWREVPYRGLVVMLEDAATLIGVAGLDDLDAARQLLASLSAGTYSR